MVSDLLIVAIKREKNLITCVLHETQQVRVRMTKYSRSRDDDRLDRPSSSENIQQLQIPRRHVSVIASTWFVKHKLSPAEGLVIDGFLECAMAHHQQHLTISEQARVQGNIDAPTVVVFGQLIGDIFSEGKVTLANGSDVRGNINCGCLQVEEGARFIGQISSGESATRTDLEYS